MPGKAIGQHQEKRLTALKVNALKEPGFYADGNGLYLKVDASGAKRWVQRLLILGKRRDIGLGSTSLVSLGSAREVALENRKLARSGGDPLAAKKRTEAILTFREAAKKVHDLHKPTWRNPKHGAQWLTTLESYAFPSMGQKRMDQISSADILSVLTPIWSARPETARRVKQRIGTVMKWGIAQGWRTDNPADTISQGLPKQDRSNVQHREALPYGKVADAIRSIQDSQASPATKLAFEFLILTATRSGEVRHAVWSELDLEKAEWIVPGSRMKAKKPHRVPLSNRCLEILNQAHSLKMDGSDLVFPSPSTGRALSDMTLSKLLRDLEIPCVPPRLPVLV